MGRVMRNTNWLVFAVLAVTLTAVAQQAASAPQNSQPVAATQAVQTSGSAEPDSDKSDPDKSGGADHHGSGRALVVHTYQAYPDLKAPTAYGIRHAAVCMSAMDPVAD